MVTQQITLVEINEIVKRFEYEKILLKTYKQYNPKEHTVITLEDIGYSFNMIQKIDDILNQTKSLSPEDILIFKNHIQKVKKEIEEIEKVKSSTIDDSINNIILKYCEQLLGYTDEELNSNYEIYFPICKVLKEFNINDNLLIEFINIYTGKDHLIEEVDGGSTITGGSKDYWQIFLFVLLLINFTQTYAMRNPGVNVRVNSDGRLNTISNTFSQDVNLNSVVDSSNPILSDFLTMPPESKKSTTFSQQLSMASTNRSNTPSVNDVLKSLSENKPFYHPHINIGPDHKHQVILPRDIMFSKKIEPLFNFVLDKFGTFNTIHFLKKVTSSLERLVDFSKFIKTHTNNMGTVVTVLKMITKFIPNLTGLVNQLDSVIRNVKYIDEAVLSNSEVITTITDTEKVVLAELLEVLRQESDAENLEAIKGRGGRKSKNSRKTKKQKKFMKSIKKKKSKRIMK